MTQHLILTNKGKENNTQGVNKMINNIANQLKNLGVELKGSLNIEIDSFDDNKVKVFDMNITTFEKTLVGVYYKKLDTLFRVESLGL